MELAALADTSDCIVVAVPDRAAVQVAARLARWHPRVVLQTCGGLGPSALRPLLAAGSACATFHPLQALPTRESGVARLPGSAFGACGPDPAATWCERLVRPPRGTLLRVPEERLPLYHAAAVLASNCAVGLVDAAVALLRNAGLEPAQALAALSPLLAASLGNALTMGTERALTGSVPRGDAGTVERHLEARRDLPQPLQSLYREFGRYLVGLAERRGLACSDAGALRRLLRGGA